MCAVVGYLNYKMHGAMIMIPVPEIMKQLPPSFFTPSPCKFHDAPPRNFYLAPTGYCSPPDSRKVSPRSNNDLEFPPPSRLHASYLK